MAYNQLVASVSNNELYICPIKNKQITFKFAYTLKQFLYINN